MSGLALAEAALRLVGTPFRLHGRDPATGLDCIGVLEVALRAAGHRVQLPRAYSLRTSRPAGMERIAGDCGFSLAHGSVRPGDVLFVRVSACQFHLLLAARGGTFVHAHAGLGKVVTGPLPSQWRIVGHWRLTEKT